MIYIKIKHIKNFLMIVACLSLASFNYFTYAETADGGTEKICDQTLDSDCDGLINSEEKLYGTNPENADTDGDSYSDGVEVGSGFDPLKPAPGDKIALANANASVDNSVGTETFSATENFSNDMLALIQSKNDQAITREEINNLVNEQLNLNLQEDGSFETLPEIDRSQIKILKQDYSALSSKERAEKEATDAFDYINNVAYLLISNSPTQLITRDDFIAFQDEFFSHMADLSDSNSDLEYFSDLGKRLEIFSNQVNDVQVPETMVDMHIKFLRIVKGILTLQNNSSNADDPLGRALIFAKAIGYVELMSDFFQNDIKNYLEQLEIEHNK